MYMKYLYFIRHAETESNAKGRPSRKQDSLSSAGCEQAKQVIERVRELAPDALAVSTMPRTLETAGIINEKLQLPQYTSNTLIERRMSDGFYDLTAEEKQPIRREMREKADDPHWHYADEENFVEHRERAIKALRELAEYEEETVLVVSHKRMMQMIAAVVLHGMYIEPDVYFDLEDRLRVDHTGITHILITDDGTYELAGWNDIRHLFV